jgi:hypothetical protein
MPARARHDRLFARCGATAAGGLALAVMEAGAVNKKLAVLGGIAILLALGVAVPGQEPVVCTVAGRVLGPEGKPLAGALVHVVTAKGQPARVGKADSSGAFSFDLAARPASWLAVAAIAVGYGFAFAEVAAPDAEKPIELKLTADLPIRGRILDSDGQPVDGVVVRVESVRVPGSLDALISGRLDGSHQSSQFALWEGWIPGSPEVVRTSAGGRFTITGLGAGRLVRLLLDGPRIHCAPIEVMTRAASGDNLPMSLLGEVCYFADFEHVSPAARTVRGVVREHGTGKPVQEATVEGLSSLPHPVVTDAEGRFEVRGCVPRRDRAGGLNSKRKLWCIDVQPKQATLLATQVVVDDDGEVGPLAVAIQLHPGIVVRGKVTDAVSGQPVAGEVRYEPLRPNPFVAKLGVRTWSKVPTDTSGSYAIAVLPGPGVLCVRLSDAAGERRYLAPKVSQADVNRMIGKELRGSAGVLMPEFGGMSQFSEPLITTDKKAIVLINPEEGARPFERDLRLEPGRTLEGRLVGPTGEPVTGVSVHGLEASPRPAPRVLESDRFVIEGLDAESKRQLVFHHAEKKLALRTSVSSDAKAPLEFKLVPCGSLSVRLLDPNGLPLRDTLVEVKPGILRLGTRRERTDGDGNLFIDGLFPRVMHMMSVVGAVPIMSPTVTPEAGKTTELGNQTLEPEQVRIRQGSAPGMGGG